MSLAPLPDASSAAAPAAGDDAALWQEQVIRDHYRGLYTYAFSLCGSSADAADLTQQTAVIFATKWADIRDPSRVKAWLYSTIHREFLKLHRSRARAGMLDEKSYEAATATGPDQERAHDGSAAMQALQSLDEPHRSVLALHYVEDLSYREISEALDVPIGTVMSRLSRAKDAIRRLLSLSAS
jgi:RNA polymerase sigma-70 factor (ECF subfamily)